MLSITCLVSHSYFIVSVWLHRIQSGFEGLILWGPVISILLHMGL
jgi:hypothetical protein